MTTPAARISSMTFSDPANAQEAAHQVCRHYTGAENDVKPHEFDLLRNRAEDLMTIILLQPPSPERSTAIAKVREALSWAIAGLVMPRG